MALDKNRERWLCTPLFEHRSTCPWHQCCPRTDAPLLTHGGAWWRIGMARCSTRPALPLLGIREVNDLLGHISTGASWEGFCIEQICCQLPAGASVSFYRSAAGAELDLVLENGSKKNWLRNKTFICAQSHQGVLAGLRRQRRGQSLRRCTGTRRLGHGQYCGGGAAIQNSSALGSEYNHSQTLH